jgi:tRNA (guanine-N7-)-methyltransferase
MARGRHPSRIYISPPDEHVAAKYLHSWYGGDVVNNPQQFPGLTSTELFGNTNNLEIDFGCGTGVLACNRAAQNPEINVIGIDVSQKPIFCAINEANARGISNVKFIRNNFNVLLPLLKPQSVSAAYYLFPNPPHDYNQERANKRRLEFLEAIYNALADGGKFTFATDSKAMFECMIKIIHTELHYKTHEIDIISSDIFTWYRSIWESRGRAVMGIAVEKQ